MNTALKMISSTTTGFLSTKSSQADLLSGKIPNGVATALLRYKAPTGLHELFRQSDVKLRELQEVLEFDPSAAAVAYSRGQLPLHILGNNDNLITDPIGKNTATIFACMLHRTYPKAVTTRDSEGLMPFVRVIKDWHCWVYESHAKRKETNKGATNYATTLIGKIGEICNIQMMNSLTTSNSEIRGKNINTPATVDDLSARLCPPGVELWEEVEWSFEIMSIVMDEFGGKGSGRAVQKEKQHGSFRKLDPAAIRGADDGTCNSHCESDPGNTEDPVTVGRGR